MAVDVVRKLSKLLLSNTSQQQKEILQQTIDTFSRDDVHYLHNLIEIKVLNHVYYTDFESST